MRQKIVMFTEMFWIKLTLYCGSDEKEKSLTHINSQNNNQLVKL